eukprot:TRINITY_DN60171_c0_g1_i2.p1 TRINITY_DN60171_c0_g1~~TRINITY_DN60171_c0_g1_i2.p1  ORF type:complete len:317 (+),score=52.73 TRINITY_DN60171_c0_g1_i2:32-982(+)
MGAALRAAKSFCAIKRQTILAEKETVEVADPAALLEAKERTGGKPGSDEEEERFVVKIEGAAVSNSICTQGACWPVIALHSRLEGCGGSVYADSAKNPRALCYVGSGLQFGRFDAGSAQDHASIAVCIAALEEALQKGRQSCPFWYLERSLIGPLRGAMQARFGNQIRLRESPNKMGMFVLPHYNRPKAESFLPEKCTLRNLRDEDALQVNMESGPGPNQMDRARTGCWGVEVAGRLKGWAVRGSDGAIGMLKVDEAWRQRGLATAIIRQISDELRSHGLPCFAYVRDDNLPSRRTFFKVGYEHVADVKFCFLQFM